MVFPPCLPSQFSCCGVENYMDWYNVIWNASCPNVTDECVPVSCCVEQCTVGNVSSPDVFFDTVSKVWG